MTPENWPEPVGCGFITKAVSATSETSYVQVLGHGVYTATQVREIVAAETAQLKLDANEMVRQMLDAMKEAEDLPVSDDYLAAMRYARKWLKENKE